MEVYSEIVEGWLHVWDVDHDLERRLFSAGRHPVPKWEPRFCVLTIEDCLLTFSKTEQTDSDQNDKVKLFRLDGGREHFHRRWGYNLLDIIAENAVLHCTDTDEDMDNTCPSVPLLLRYLRHILLDIYVMVKIKSPDGKLRSLGATL
ncbi:hypothetical protein Btru_004043 [Bulinus truncatus]|nr:hypothetical protein Btru_004043 [Bulinus truncatus]